MNNHEKREFNKFVFKQAWILIRKGFSKSKALKLTFNYYKGIYNDVHDNKAY